MKCRHDGSRICGAGWRNNVFRLVWKPKAAPKPVAAVYKSIFGESYYGCYKDGGNRDLPKLLRAGYGNPKKCFQMAMDGGFKYVGMQYRGECWAGQKVGKYGKRPDKECNMKCRHDNSRMCGGGWRNSVFELKIVPPKKDAKQVHNTCNEPKQEVTGKRHSDHRMGLPYLGCFLDRGSRDLTPIDMNTSPEKCFATARNRGFEFAAMQNGNACFGGN
jgi:hypothetical protein